MKQFNNYTLSILAFFALLAIVTPYAVSAQTDASASTRVCQEVPLPRLPGLPDDPCSSPAAYIQYWFYFALYLAGIAALVMAVFGGVLYMFSSAMPGVQKGTKYITNAALGLILLFGSWLLLQMLGGPQLTTLKNPVLPELPTCFINISPTPPQTGEELTLSWEIKTKGAENMAFSCSDPAIPHVATELAGKVTYTATKAEKTTCIFDVKDKAGASLKKCSASYEVKPFMCRLSYDIDGLLTGSGDIEWKVGANTTEGTLTCSATDISCHLPGNTLATMTKTCPVIPPGKVPEDSISINDRVSGVNSSCALTTTSSGGEIFSCAINFITKRNWFW